MTATTNPRRAAEPDLVELPYGIRIALKRIAADLQDMPRECVVDRHELLMWKNRIARRILGLERTKVPAERPTWGGPKGTHSVITLAAKPALSEAEAVFGTTPTRSRSRPTTRTVTSRKGKQVRVETRASSRQFELPW